MSGHTVTLHLSPDLYERLEQRAQAKARSLEEEVRVIVEEAYSNEQLDLSPELSAELSSLSLLEDGELWRAARSQVPDEAAARMQTLVEKHQREGLSSHEAEEAIRLSQFATHVMLVRAEAAQQLKRRGLDISPLREASGG